MNHEELEDYARKLELKIFEQQLEISKLKRKKKK